MEEKSLLEQKLEEFNDLNEAYLFGETFTKFSHLKEVAKNIAISNGFLEIDYESDFALKVNVLLDGSAKGKFFMGYDDFEEQIKVVLTPSLYLKLEVTFSQKFYSKNVISFESDSSILKEGPILANSKGIEEMFALLLSKMIELAYGELETSRQL